MELSTTAHDASGPPYRPMPYSYEPLGSDGDHIRLFTVARSYNHDFNLTMSTFHMDRCPRYEAVSYEWQPAGMPEESRTILVNHQILEISPNARGFLIAYANLKKVNIVPAQNPEYLWLDQISINQSDVNERGHQVQLMSRIYSNAALVYAWMRDGSERTLGYLNTSEARSFLDKWNSRGIRVDSDEIDYLTDAEASLALTLGDLVKHDLWQRLWVQQEMILARQVVLLAGDEMVDAATFTRYLELFLNRTARLAGFLVNGSTQAITDDHQAVQGLLTSRQVDLGLVEAMDRFASKLCSDPRDKVYALMSMVRKDERVEVDYTIDSTALFRQVVVMLARSHREREIRFPRNKLISQGSYLVGGRYLAETELNEILRSIESEESNADGKMATLSVAEEAKAAALDEVDQSHQLSQSNQSSEPSQPSTAIPLVKPGRQKISITKLLKTKASKLFKHK